MSAELDALKAAEAALEAAKAAIVSAESHVGGAAPSEPVKTVDVVEAAIESRRMLGKIPG